MYDSQVLTFSALADPTRFGIVELLARQGSLSASEISKNFSSSAQAISQHLKVLHHARLVKMQKRAQQRIYALDVSAMTAAEQWLNDRVRQWDTRLDAMDSYLQTIKKEH